jgi:hypothetical protein
MSPGGAGPARASRRQYAANQGTYFEADPSAGQQQHGDPNAQSTFFSPSDPAVGATPAYYQGAGGNTAGGDQYGNNQGYSQGGDPQQQQQGGAGLASQFGQMGLGPTQPFQVSTTNLVGLPLNPAELFGSPPPEIRLPPNVNSLRLAEFRCVTDLTRIVGYVLPKSIHKLRSILSASHNQRSPDEQYPSRQI